MTECWIYNHITGLVAAVGVLLGVAFGYLEVRSLVSQRQTDIETRQAQLFMQIYSHFHDEDFLNDEKEITPQWNWKNYDDFMEKYGPDTNPEAFTKWDSIGTYYKGIGMLVKRKLIDLSLVDDLISDNISLYWGKFEPLIRQLREHTDWPRALEGVEYLYNELQKREQTLQAQQ